MIKVIIAGSRGFNDYEELCLTCDKFLGGKEVQIVSGTARGADKLGERYAKKQGFPIKEFPANWNKHGKSAGYIRNSEMADYADVLIAFWDDKSRGTKHMIDLAKQKGLKVIIVSYNYKKDQE